MARPIKVGIEYFGLDVVFDEKVQFIEELYGAEGFYFWIKLLQRIYSSGYFIEWNKFQAIMLRKQTTIELDRIDEILESCLEVGLFSRDLFDQYGVLTSRGIQKRFFIVANKRKEVDIFREYVLNPELLKWCSGKNGESTGVNSEKTHDENELIPDDSEETTENHGLIPNTDEKTTGEEGVSSDNVGINPASKVKQSKAKQSKAKKSKPRAPKTPKIPYAENVEMTEAEYQKLADKYGTDATAWMIEKLDNYKGANGKKYNSDYRAILNWVVEKYREQAGKGLAPKGRSDVNDSVESDFGQQDFNDF